MENQNHDDEIHIGREIRLVLRRERRSAVWLAEKLHCDRTNIYKLFKKRSIDLELLMRVSLALEYNFFEKYAWRISERLALLTD